MPFYSFRSLPPVGGRERGIEHGVKAMKINNNKGFGLIELLVVIAVVALSVPVVLSVYIYGLQFSSTYSRYMEQHFQVVDVTQRIRKDIEEAAAYRVVYTPHDSSPNALVLWIPEEDAGGEIAAGDYTIRIWKLENEKLLLKTCAADSEIEVELGGSGFEPVLEGLDTSVVGGDALTRFERVTGERLLLSVKPVEKNAPLHRNRNVTKPIITEFSVLYKESL